ncbi:MAG: hypothetical protein U9R47_07150, partial [Actinomycetota bacterium]|nr:hypothetical protein [Actinomycetota bacterium]
MTDEEQPQEPYARGDSNVRTVGSSNRRTENAVTSGLDVRVARNRSTVPKREVEVAGGSCNVARRFERA